MKRILILILALLMCLTCFVACDKDDDTEAGGGGGNTDFVEVSDSEWTARFNSIAEGNFDSYSLTTAISQSVVDENGMQITASTTSTIRMDLKNQKCELYGNVDYGNGEEASIDQSFVYKSGGTFYGVAKDENDNWTTETADEYTDTQSIEEIFEDVVVSMISMADSYASLRSSFKYDASTGKYVMSMSGMTVEISFPRDNGFTMYIDMGGLGGGMKTVLSLYDINSTVVNIPQ